MFLPYRNDTTHDRYFPDPPTTHLHLFNKRSLTSSSMPGARGKVRTPCPGGVLQGTDTHLESDYSLYEVNTSARSPILSIQPHSCLFTPSPPLHSCLCYPGLHCSLPAFRVFILLNLFCRPVQTDFLKLQIGPCQLHS